MLPNETSNSGALMNMPEQFLSLHHFRLSAVWMHRLKASNSASHACFPTSLPVSNSEAMHFAYAEDWFVSRRGVGRTEDLHDETAVANFWRGRVR